MVCFLDFNFAGQQFRHNLVRTITTIGRHSNCDIVLQDQTISRLHITIACLDLSKYWLFDGVHDIYNPSSNGVYVNNVKVNGSVMLKLKDRIRFGNVRAMFDCQLNANEINKSTLAMR